MAIVALTTDMAAGVNYTYTADTFADWPAIPNDAYFYDLDVKIVYYKDITGNIIGAYDPDGDTSPTLRNATSTDTFAAASETINCTSGTFTVNLPTAVGIQGTTYTLVNSGAGIITLDGNGTETINGSLTIDLSSQYISRTVQSDGSNWIII